MINYRSLLKFFILPIFAVTTGIVTGIFIKDNNKTSLTQSEKINPPVSLKGCVYNETQQLPAQYNLVVGFYKNYEDIQNATPITRTILKNTERCFSMRIDPDLVTSPGFLVSYTVPPTVFESIPPEKGTIINDWYTAITFPENMYKNLFLSEKWDIVPEQVEEFILKKTTLAPQEKKTLLWNSEQLTALTSSKDYESKGADEEELDNEFSDEKNTDMEIKKLLQQNGVDLTNGFTSEAKNAYHRLISEYFDYLYTENERASENEENTPLKQFSFKEFLADKRDRLEQLNKLSKSDLELEKRLSSATTLLSQKNTLSTPANTETKPEQIIPDSSNFPEKNIKTTELNNNSAVIKKEGEKVSNPQGMKKFPNKDKSNQPVQKEKYPYTINGDIYPPAGIRDLCSMSDKTVPFISVDLFLTPLTKNYPSVPRDYTLHTEVPLVSSFVDCKDKSFSLKDFYLENEVGKESPPTYFYAFVYEPVSPNQFEILYSGTDEKYNGVPPSLLSKRSKDNNTPIEIRLSPMNRVDETLFSMELFDLYDYQKTIDDAYVKPLGLDVTPKLDSMVSIYNTAISKSAGWARLKSLPIGSYIPFDIADTRGADSYLPVSFNILSTTPDFTTSIPMVKQNNVKPGTSNIVISIPPYFKEGEVLLVSPNSKNKSSYIFNANNKSNLILARDLNFFDKTLLDLRIDNKSLGLMPIFPHANRLLVVEPVPKTIKTLKGTISILKNLGKPPVPCTDCKINVLYTEKSTSTNKDGAFYISEISILDDMIEYEIESKAQKKILGSTLVSRSMNNLELKITIPDPSLTEAWAKNFPTSPSEGMFYGDYDSYKSYKAFVISQDKNISKKALYFDDNATPSDKLNATSSNTNSPGTDRFMFSGLIPGNYILYLISDKVLHIRPIRIEPDTITIY